MLTVMMHPLVHKRGGGLDFINDLVKYVAPVNSTKVCTMLPLAVFRSFYDSFFSGILDNVYHRHFRTKYYRWVVAACRLPGALGRT